MLNPGTVIGDRYIVKRKLAEGGMAEIYLCTAMGPEGFKKDVVLKCIRSFWGNDDMFVQMFIAEARLASRLNHANIVQIFHFDKHEDSYYLAMEYVNGPSLRDFLQRTQKENKPLPILMASEIMANIARGLHYAHNLNIVHRDVSPHNILLSFDGNIKLADFGIAKTDTQLTSPGVLKGKFAYMAPEQARGEAVDARTDIFALGIVLWEALTRSRLFEYDSYANALQALQENLIVQPSRFNSEIPEELDGIVLKALSRNPAERYSSAQEFERALANFILTHARSADDTNLSHFLKGVYGDAPIQLGSKEGLTRTCTPAAPPRESKHPATAVGLKPKPKTDPPRKTPSSGKLSSNPVITKEEFAYSPPPTRKRKTFFSRPAVAFLTLVAGAGIGMSGALYWEDLTELWTQPQKTLIPPNMGEVKKTAQENSGRLGETGVAAAASPQGLAFQNPEPALPKADVSAPTPTTTPTPSPPPNPPAAPAGRNEAKLIISAKPWAVVSINHVERGEVAGRKEFRLPLGTYRVKLWHNSKEEVRTLQLREAKSYRIHFDAAAPP